MNEIKKVLLINAHLSNENKKDVIFSIKLLS